MLGQTAGAPPTCFALGVPVILVPSTNADNNQHAKNENARLGNLWDAIEVYSQLLTME